MDMYENTYDKNYLKRQKNETNMPATKIGQGVGVDYLSDQVSE